jgi:ABC-type proline/glycine betaine transport system ATPase subunit
VRKTVVLVTHDMREAIALADRVGVLEAGQLVACDEPSALRASTDPAVALLMESCR